MTFAYLSRYNYAHAHRSANVLCIVQLTRLLHISVSLYSAIFTLCFSSDQSLRVSNQLFSYPFAVSSRTPFWNWKHFALCFPFYCYSDVLRCTLCVRLDNPSPRTPDKTRRDGVRRPCVSPASLRRAGEAYNINSTSAPSANRMFCFSKLHISIT